MLISMIHLVIDILSTQIPNSKSMQEEETLLRLPIAEGRRRNVKFKRVIIVIMKFQFQISNVKFKQ